MAQSPSRRKIYVADRERHLKHELKGGQRSLIEKKRERRLLTQERGKVTVFLGEKYPTIHDVSDPKRRFLS